MGLMISLVFKIFKMEDTFNKMEKMHNKWDNFKVKIMTKCITMANLITTISTIKVKASNRK